MAKFTHVPAEVEITEVEKTPAKFVIELNRDDAERMLALHGMVGLGSIPGIYFPLSDALWGTSGLYEEDAKYHIEDEHGKQITYIRIVKNT